MNSQFKAVLKTRRNRKNALVHQHRKLLGSESIFSIIASPLPHCKEACGNIDEIKDFFGFYQPFLD